MVGLTQKELKRILNYDPETGVFVWKYRVSKGVRAGDIAGCLHPSGYWHIGYKRRTYRAHRLAFLYMVGEMPHAVDHIDQTKRNNAWDNLREATRSQNGGNVGLISTNATGYKGVHYRQDNQKFRAYITFEGERIHLGSFATPEEAALAYNEKAKELHGEFAYLNKL